MKIEAKRCSQCGKSKAKYDFYKASIHLDKLRSECKLCTDGHSKEYRGRSSVNPQYKKQYDARDLRRKQTNKLGRDRLKLEVLNAYGGKCTCCSENLVMLLTIDHINGEGTKHRNSITRNSIGLYRWLRRNNYPEGFQVLCFNCNRGKHFNNGVCPHKSLHS